MNNLETLVPLFREAESLLYEEGNIQAAEWVGSICDSLSLGDTKSLSEFRSNLGGMGGFWEASNSKKFQRLIGRIGDVLEESAL